MWLLDWDCNIKKVTLSIESSSLYQLKKYQLYSAQSCFERLMLTLWKVPIERQITQFSTVNRRFDLLSTLEGWDRPQVFPGDRDEFKLLCTIFSTGVAEALFSCTGPLTVHKCCHCVRDVLLVTGSTISKSLWFSKGLGCKGWITLDALFWKQDDVRVTTVSSTWSDCALGFLDDTSFFCARYAC